MCGFGRILLVDQFRRHMNISIPSFSSDWSNRICLIRVWMKKVQVGPMENIVTELASSRPDRVLSWMPGQGFISEFRSGKIMVELTSRLNNYGVISPQFDAGVKEIEG